MIHLPRLREVRAKTEALLTDIVSCFATTLIVVLNGSASDIVQLQYARAQRLKYPCQKLVVIHNLRRILITDEEFVNELSLVSSRQTHRRDF